RQQRGDDQTRAEVERWDVVTATHDPTKELTCPRYLSHVRGVVERDVYGRLRPVGPENVAVRADHHLVRPQPQLAARTFIDDHLVDARRRDHELRCVGQGDAVRHGPAHDPYRPEPPRRTVIVATRVAPHHLDDLLVQGLEFDGQSWNGVAPLVVDADDRSPARWVRAPAGDVPAHEVSPEPLGPELHDRPIDPLPCDL